MDFIYYFSGTGNSQAFAKRVAGALGCQTAAITREFLDAPREVRLCERAVVVFPSYAYGLPELVREFLSQEFFRADYLALAVTCGSSAGGSLASARRILRKRGVSSDYFHTVQTVENYLPLFGEGNAEVTARRLALQNEAAETLVKAIEAESRNRINGFRPFSAMVSGLFRIATPLLAKRIHVSESCTGCGICARVCPAKAIVLEEGVPAISKRNCNQCQACLNVCPEHALTMWRFNSECRQYLHPDVPLSDLIKR